MEEIAESLIQTIGRRLRAGRRIWRRLPGGRLHVDSPIPFLCIYRRPADRPDRGTRRLVVGEGSYLLAGVYSEDDKGLDRLLAEIAQSLSDAFGAALFLEVWSRPGQDPHPGRSVRPVFRVLMADEDPGRPTAAALVRALRRIRIFGHRAGVELSLGAPSFPPGMAPLLEAGLARRLGTLTIGLEVPPVYQGVGTDELYPKVLRLLHRQLSEALRQASFRFAHLQTTHRPAHFQTLGQRTLLRRVREADEQLAGVSASFDLLLCVTPVNARQALGEFRAGRCSRAPAFHYRLLNFDPDVLKRRLFGISLELVEDPALAELMREKREELDRQITLLHDRSTPNFIYGSLQLYGGVDAALRQAAGDLLAATAAPADRARHESFVDAAGFARRARAEIELYRTSLPELTAAVELRSDISGLLVSRDRLLVGEAFRAPRSRVDALLHHEIGTHLLTYCNAQVQPLKLLAAGLPGYDALQEGTAVIAEYLVGGLGRLRLRQLAARAMAVDRMVAGSTFVEVFEELHEQLGFSVASAFTTTMRVFRGGGFTKDAVYLRGLMRLLDYLAAGGELEPLFLGKVSESSLAIVQELRWRRVLQAAPLSPRYLDCPGAAERLDRLRQGASLLDLLKESP